MDKEMRTWIVPVGMEQKQIQEACLALYEPPYESTEDDAALDLELTSRHCTQDWSAAFVEALEHVTESFFSDDEWNAIRAALNGTLGASGTRILFMEMSDYFYYNEGCDEVALLHDLDGQKVLLEKIQKLSYFEELAVITRVKRWWRSVA